MSSLWHRVGADPGLTESLNAALGGREDALDLLWWAEHPGDPSPDGRPDPALRIEEARRALYRGAPSTGDPDAVVAAAAERAMLLERALDAARAVVAVRDGPVRPPAMPAGATPEPTEDDAVRRERPRRPVLLDVLALGVALVVGVAIGALGFGAANGSTASHAAVPAFRTFDRAQRPALDLPGEPDAVPSFLDPRSVRRLRADTSIGTTLYAARARDGRVCVLVVVLAQPSPPACTSSAAFAIGGLSLIVRATADPVDDTGRRPVDELDLTWDADGTVSITPFEVGSTAPTTAGP